MQPTERTTRRTLLLLAVGGMIGVLCGAISALRGGGLPLDKALAAPPDGVIALVNGKPIREEEYVNAVALLAGDKREELTDEDRAHVLTRLIEEELLVQGGIANGVVDTDRSVRRAMTQALLDSIMAESASELPTEEELRDFYERHLSLFTQQSSSERTLEKATMEVPGFASRREQVAVAYLRRSRDEALREYLDWLRAEAKIAVLLPSPLAGGG